ncbi:nuclear transport factor 2 family protein [Sphingomonas sp. CL5.1]|uniref:nuclear transport factor 2 family protein n=1 Tax=Sphingomonas sp. CL5.1 TaxID=2653203 RepID=UPI0015813CEB|nr:nuclear transport factor 2 family protein [Sphingomonas sp. CL5.1]QKR99316.1 nuclear transport factor 2 family protein [Sphingomonas sp. CL5.1]
MSTDGKDITGVLAAERRRGEALVARDFAALRAMIAPDVTHTHTRGVTDGFASYFRFIEEELAFLECDRGPLTVRLIGDVAVMTGEMTNRVLPRGKDASILTRAQVLQIWEWRADRWMLVAFQSTNLPPVGA